MFTCETCKQPVEYADCVAHYSACVVDINIDLTDSQPVIAVTGDWHYRIPELAR